MFHPDHPSSPASARTARAASGDLARTLLLIAVATLAGLLLMGVALWLHDETLGRIFWWGGMVVWLAGDALAVLRFHHRGVARGDW